MAYSIVQSASQQLETLLVADAKYSYGVHDKVVNLQGQLIHMNFFLQDADNREYQEAQVRQWVAEIREIAYEAGDIIERLKLEGCKISAESTSELETLPHLKELVLVNDAIRDSKIATSAEGFPQVVALALQVEFLDRLEEWKLLRKEALPNLGDLNVKGCPTGGRREGTFLSSVTCL